MSMAFCNRCDKLVDTDFIGINQIYPDGSIDCDMHMLPERDEPSTYEQLMTEAKLEFEQAMRDQKSVRVAKLLDHTLPKSRYV